MTDHVMRDARKQLSMPRRELAEIFGVAESTVYRWENHQTSIPGSVMIALSFMLLVPRDFWPPILEEFKVA